MRPTSRRRFPSWQCATTYRKKDRESEHRLSLRFGAGLFIVSFHDERPCYRFECFARSTNIGSERKKNKEGKEGKR